MEAWRIWTPDRKKGGTHEGSTRLTSGSADLAVKNKRCFFFAVFRLFFVFRSLEFLRVPFCHPSPWTSPPDVRGDMATAWNPSPRGEVFFITFPLPPLACIPAFPLLPLAPFIRSPSLLIGGGCRDSSFSFPFLRFSLPPPLFRCFRLPVEFGGEIAMPARASPAVLRVITSAAFLHVGAATSYDLVL